VITFKVTPDGGEPYTVTATSRDAYVWEKTSRGKTVKTALEGGSIVDLTEIAYYAVRRQGLFTGTLQEFAASHDIDAAEEDEPDPTHPAP